jgi:hypothetical protein
MTNKELKHGFIEAHRKLMGYWARGRDYRNCPLCELARDKNRNIHCLWCTQGWLDTWQNCVYQKTAAGGFRRGTINLVRAEYHRRVMIYLESLPPETFNKKRIHSIQAAIEKIDREVAQSYLKGNQNDR